MECPKCGVRMRKMPADSREVESEYIFLCPNCGEIKEEK